MITRSVVRRAQPQAAPSIMIAFMNPSAESFECCRCAREVAHKVTETEQPKSITTQSRLPRTGARAGGWAG